MTSEHITTGAVEALRNASGIVIPVYIPPDNDPALGRNLLEETVTAFQREVSSPEAICLSVDGVDAGGDIAVEFAARYGVRTVITDKNRGKLAAVMNGMRHLIPVASLKYFVVVDQDGDHFANELLNLVRAARHVERVAATAQVMVLGRRISRHRPMGYLRGELEELADRILLDALHYDAVAAGKPLNLQFATTLEEFPDFHSGYKLFTRTTAERIFSADPWSGGLSDDCVYRHAVEAVLSVEAIKSGALLTLVNRSTIDEQPLTAFGRLNLQRLTADKIIWPCKRLHVPPEFVRQWLDNHLPRLQLGSLVPQGKEELLGIRRLVRAAFDLPDDGRDDIIRPHFV